MCLYNDTFSEDKDRKQEHHLHEAIIVQQCPQ